MTIISLLHQARFLTSAAQLSQLPPDQGIEVAFVGRSNTGKSSALNALTNIKGLAKTSKTPGRTQLINLFTLDEHRRLVDLPGYGYAEVPEDIRKRWQKTLGQYLTSRHCLNGLVLLMDIRHPLKELDYGMLELANSAKLPVHILLTKADKLSHSAATNTLKKVHSVCNEYEDVSVQTFSVLNGNGLPEAHKKLGEWLHPTQKNPREPK